MAELLYLSNEFMRLVVVLLILVVAALGSTIWYGRDMVGQRDAQIASLTTLVSRLKEENATTGAQNAAGGEAELAAENAMLRDELALLRSQTTATAADLTEAEHLASANQESLNERLSALRAERDQLIDRADTAEGRVELLQSELRAALAGAVDPELANTDAAELQVEVTMLRHERDAARAQIDLLLQQNAALHENAAPQGDTIALNDHMTEVDSLIGEIEMLETELAEQRAGTALLETRLAEGRTTDEAQLDSVRAENDALSATVSAAQAENEQLLTANQDLNTELSLLQAKIAEQDQSLDRMAAETDSVSVTSLSTELENLQLELAVRERTVGKLEENLASLTAGAEANRSELDALNARNQELTNQTADLIEQVANLTESNATLTQNKIDLTRQNVEFAERSAGFGEQISALNNQIAELNQQVDLVNGEKTQALERLALLDGELASKLSEDQAQAAKRENEARLRIQQLEFELNSLRTVQAQAEARIDELQTANAQMFSNTELKDATREAARSIEEQNQATIAELRAQLEGIEQAQSDGERSTLVLQEERDQALAQVSAMREQITRLQNERTSFIEASESALVNADEAQNLLIERSQQQIERFEQEIASMNEERSVLERTLIEQTGELNLLRGEMSRLQTELARAEEQNQINADLATIKVAETTQAQTQSDASLLPISTATPELAAELEELKKRNRELERFVADNTPRKPELAPRDE